MPRLGDAFAYSEALENTLLKAGLHWLLDFIAANQKRVRKRIQRTQEWVFSFDDQHRGVLNVFALHPRKTHHFTFNFTITPYHGEPVHLFLDEGMLLTKEERDASL